MKDHTDHQEGYYHFIHYDYKISSTEDEERLNYPEGLWEMEFLQSWKL